MQIFSLKIKVITSIRFWVITSHRRSPFASRETFIPEIIDFYGHRIQCSPFDFQDSELCISLGLSLQYLRVSVVCWLAAMCHHLYATVASLPRRDDPPTYIKYSLFAWGAPLISLALATFLQSRESHDLWNVVDLTPFNCW